MPHAGESLLLELFVIFVSAKLLGELFERMRLPAVLGEMLAGVLLGPSALALIHPGNITTALAGRVWWAWPVAALGSLPPLRALLHRGYRWFAANRHRFSRSCAIHRTLPAEAKRPAA